MAEKNGTNTEMGDGIDLHPRHESWARMTTRSNLIGFIVLLVFLALLVFLITAHATLMGLVVVGVIVVLIVLWLLLRSGSGRHTGPLGDAEVTASIKAALLTDLNAHSVNVDTSRGVVTLRGSVPYADFRGAAEQLAKRHGARQVINELKVAEAAPPPPAAVPEDFAGVTTPEGAPEVAGPPLEEAVREALEADKRVNMHLITMRVEEGIVYLTGRQENVEARDAATEVAAHVPGIVGVDNDMEVLPSY